MYVALLWECFSSDYNNFIDPFSPAFPFFQSTSIIIKICKHWWGYLIISDMQISLSATLPHENTVAVCINSGILLRLSFPKFSPKPYEEMLLPWKCTIIMQAIKPFYNNPHIIRFRANPSFGCSNKTWCCSSTTASVYTLKQ